jgi:predicted DNA-binding transcriptional regulator YafY
MRASRLLSILLLLQTRGRVTARALAEEFETSARTIYRDIDQLSAAGVPVYADRGPGGGFSLLEGYRTRLTGLNADEAETLFLAGLPGPAADLGLGEALAAAQLKLLASLTDEGRSGAERLARRFHLDPIAWFRSREHAEVLPKLAEAVLTSRRIRVVYDSWTAEVERELEPLGLTLKAGVWYLVAQAAGTPRTYRVSRFRALEVTETVFAPPAGFDLAAFWGEWVTAFEARLLRGEARLRLSPEGLRGLCALNPAIERAARAAGPPGPDGWTEAVIPIESVEHAAGDILKLGVEAEVLGPPELRERVAEIVRSLGAVYGARSS